MSPNNVELNNTPVEGWLLFIYTLVVNVTIKKNRLRHIWKKVKSGSSAIQYSHLQFVK